MIDVDLQSVIILIKTIGLPTALAILFVWINRKDKETYEQILEKQALSCREDAKEIRKLHIEEREKLYMQIDKMNERHVEAYNKVAEALDKMRFNHDKH